MKKILPTWIDSSPHLGEGYLSDEEYNSLNTYTRPLLAHLLYKYTNDTHDSMDMVDQFLRKYVGELLFIGIDCLPIAIEISQWGYETSLMLQERPSNLDATLERQGSQIKEVIIGDYLLDIPESRVVIHAGIVNKIPDQDILSWFKRLYHRADEILFGADNDRDWPSFLKYKVDYLEQNAYTSYFSLNTRR
jgi:hypothetical protein